MPSLFKIIFAGHSQRREAREERRRGDLRDRTLKKTRETKFEQRYERNQRNRPSTPPDLHALEPWEQAAIRRNRTMHETSRHQRSAATRRNQQGPIFDRFDASDLESTAGPDYSPPDRARYGHVTARNYVPTVSQTPGRHWARGDRAEPDIVPSSRRNGRSKNIHDEFSVRPLFYDRSRPRSPEDAKTYWNNVDSRRNYRPSSFGSNFSY